MARKKESKLDSTSAGVSKKTTAQKATPRKDTSQRTLNKELGADDVQFLVDCLEKTIEATESPIPFNVIAESRNITKDAARMRYKRTKDKLAKLGLHESNGKNQGRSSSSDEYVKAKTTVEEDEDRLDNEDDGAAGDSSQLSDAQSLASSS